MLEQFEEARSIRRKTRKEANSPISDEEKSCCKKTKIEREIDELITAIDFAHAEAEKYNLKLKELKEKLRKTLYSSELDLDEKARRVTQIKSQQENCEFIRKQAISRWAKLTDKKNALEKELREIKISE